MLRLSPVLPSAILNYSLGTFPIRVRDFYLSFIVSSVVYGPPTAYVGTLFSALTDVSGESNPTSDFTSPLGLSVMIIGVIATVVVTIAISWYTKQKLKIVLEEQEKIKDGQAEGGEDDIGIELNQI